MTFIKILILITLLFGVNIKLSDSYTEGVVPTEKEISEEKLMQDREIWLEDLVMCESSGNPNAINPMDLNGKPSYGLLQFQLTTFEMYSKRYKIPGELMDDQIQIQLVWQMMDDPKVRWQNEFPDCVKRLGTPPQRVLE
jgi:hypothetical protein